MDSIDIVTLINQLHRIAQEAQRIGDALEESNKIAMVSHTEMLAQQATFHEESTRGLRQAEQNSRALTEQLNAKKGARGERRS